MKAHCNKQWILSFKKLSTIQIGETGEQSRSLPAHRRVRATQHFMNIQHYGQKKKIVGGSYCQSRQDVRFDPDVCLIQKSLLQ